MFECTARQTYPFKSGLNNCTVFNVDSILELLIIVTEKKNYAYYLTS